MTNPIRKMMRVHKSNCQKLDIRYERICTCGRDTALQLYEDIEGFLLKTDEWLEENDSMASNSSAHIELDKIIARLV